MVFPGVETTKDIENDAVHAIREQDDKEKHNQQRDGSGRDGAPNRVCAQSDIAFSSAPKRKKERGAGQKQNKPHRDEIFPSSVAFFFLFVFPFF